MNLRVLMIVLLFAVVGASLEVAAVHWAFQAHHDSPWSSSGMMLLRIAVWPQSVAARLGYPGGSGIILLLMNTLGWALIGVPVGLIFRKRTLNSQQFI